MSRLVNVTVAVDPGTGPHDVLDRIGEAISDPHWIADNAEHVGKVATVDGIMSIRRLAHTAIDHADAYRLTLVVSMKPTGDE